MAYEQAQKLYNLAVSDKDGEAQEHIGCCLKQAVCTPADCLSSLQTLMCRTCRYNSGSLALLMA